MKKVSFNRFGGTEVLEVTEAAMPAGDIIVKVKAVSINPLDWKLWQGEMKLMSGRKFPKSVGIDFSGVVVKGNGQYRQDDEVFGMTSVFKGGALAEYVAVKADDIAYKPATITFEEAAALPVVGSAALQIFDKILSVKPGMHLLINGAGGGIGLLAIQLAKRAGAVVTSVVGAAAIKMAVGLGSDITMDYRQENVLERGPVFDAVIDLSGKMNYRAAKAILKKNGTYVNTSPGPKEMIASLFSGGRYKLLFLKPGKEYLNKLTTLGLKIVVSKRYEFSDFITAYTEVKKGGLPGKAVIVIN